MTPTDVDAHPVAWRECGTGPVVLFLHGLGGSRTSWDPQLTGLADRWRCVAWDMPGYGASATHGPLGFDSLGDAVIGLADTLGAETVALVGESFGGMHALHAALRHPDRVTALALANTSARFGADGTDPDVWRRARLAPIDAGATPADIARDVLVGIGGPSLRGQALEQRVAAFARIGVDGFRAAVDVLPTHDVVDRLGSIEAPTLVIAGALDDETPVAYAEVLAGGIPRARLEVLDGVGHLAMTEAPQRCNELLRDLLTTTEEHA